MAEKLDSRDRIEMLNGISRLYSKKCFDQVVDLGMAAREEYSHKYHSVSAEVADVFVGEGAVTEYTLESYERAYLTYLVATSFQNLGNHKAALVELNRIYREETALLYNYGEDPVNTLLQAALWERQPSISGFSPRPFWKRFLSFEDNDKGQMRFAERRMADLDSGTIDNRPWNIVPIGKFPSIDWDLKITGSNTGYFEVKPDRGFVKACASNTGMLISTKSWLRKIAMRHSQSYHPLVNAKTWIRLPLGIVYGISTFSAGAGLAVGGCACIFSKVGDGCGYLCKISLQGAAFLMSSSVKVADYVLKPDTRHWSEVPEAFLVTRQSNVSSEPCYGKPSVAHLKTPVDYDLGEAT